MSRPWVRDMIHFPPVRGSLAASGKSHAEAKNGDCHQFAPRHGPRNKALSLKRIGWPYPIFRDLHFHHGLLGVLLLLFAICLPLPAGEAVSIEVERDRLTAADLARVIPQWKKLDGSQVIAYAPLPGVERRVSRRQLIRWADQHGLKLNIEDLPEAVLVARRMRKLRAEEALRTVTGAVSQRYQLPVEKLRVRLHGFSEALVPAGKLSFEIRGSLRRLNQPVPITLSWRDSDGRSGTTPLRPKFQAAAGGKVLIPRQKGGGGGLRFWLQAEQLEGALLQRRGGGELLEGGARFVACDAAGVLTARGQGVEQGLETVQG